MHHTRRAEVKLEVYLIEHSLLISREVLILTLSIFIGLSGHFEGRGNSRGRRGCTTQYIPHHGSVLIQYLLIEVS